MHLDDDPAGHIRSACQYFFRAHAHLCLWAGSARPDALHDNQDLPDMSKIYRQAELALGKATFASEIKAAEPHQIRQGDLGTAYKMIDCAIMHIQKLREHSGPTHADKKLLLLLRKKLEHIERCYQPVNRRRPRT